MSVLLALAVQVAAQPPSGEKMTRARLNAMADDRRAPCKWLVLRGRQIVFRGNPDADPDKLECVLTKMSAAIEAADRAPGSHEHVPEDQ